MTKDRYIEFCKSIIGAAVDQPFEDDFLTFIARHSDSRKWFAAIMELDNRAFVNLKCAPMQADFFRNVYEGVIPAYHMNKNHWISVLLDGSVDSETVKTLVDASFNVTAKKMKKAKHPAEI